MLPCYNANDFGDSSFGVTPQRWLLQFAVAAFTYPNH
ncbi:hypothetical protein YPC_2284 [Yersinia pestis biovar Medievalis str. Harbin 35]|nr:hypothetical protein YPC_2284 [Yersinia pestis biovar Medievalis str. Harbin 35]EEO76947.1 hypothetical protein YP516_1679 [Yersinia pestis Nepal516]EEO80879.1 hypothetical protein YPF_2524 [Yersinia pestis biovar Orientalis str. India 195]EEO83835.1 hypothetical protein YPH_4480 [Yersinia pestis biovar Orientalis str. PEXU2]EEO90237.1 hypothetical protein YPS_2524 [Yersinia pestis Pestoides A]